MNRLISKILVIFILIFILTLFIEIKAFASDDIQDLNVYKATLQAGEHSEIFAKAKPIISILRNISLIVAMISITIIGVKYMVGSVDEKANYKETMRPVIIGCILITSIAVILTTIQSVFE